MWKFHKLSITYILREINVWDSRNANSAVLTHLKALNFDSYEFLHFLNAINYKAAKFRAQKVAKIAILEVLVSPKLISRKSE